MRAEILDIEDKYAALKSKYESTALLLHQYTGQPIDQTIYGATSNYHDVILNEEIISEGEIITAGEIITDGGSYPAYAESYQPETVIYGTPAQGLEPTEIQSTNPSTAAFPNFAPCHKRHPAQAKKNYRFQTTREAADVTTLAISN